MIANIREEKDSVVVFYKHGDIESTCRFDPKAAQEDFEKWDKERQTFLDEREVYLSTIKHELPEKEDTLEVKMLKEKVAELESVVASKEQLIRTMEVSFDSSRIR